MRNKYKIFIRTPERKRPHRRSRHRLDNNVRVDLREIVWEGMDWIYLAQDMDQW
jgi:hypothetical protein